MATYKLRQPVLKAEQFDGKNQAAIKELVGDTTTGDKVMLPTGEFNKDGTPKMKELVLKPGDWVTRDLNTQEIVVNPEDFPDDYEYVP